MRAHRRPKLPRFTNGAPSRPAQCSRQRRGSSTARRLSKGFATSSIPNNITVLRPCSN